MTRLFVIISAFASVMFWVTAGGAESYGPRAAVHDSAADRLISSLVGGRSAVNVGTPRQISFVANSSHRSSYAPEGPECDAGKGHSCAPHLMNSGQAAAAVGMVQRCAQVTTAITAPDARESLGLFRPPINLS